MKDTTLGFYYETVSLFTGTPLVVVLTNISRGTANRKLAKGNNNFIQSWILDSRANPISISKARKDQSNCGDCKQRRSRKNGQCYVTLIHGPQSVYNAFKRGRYTKLDLTNPNHVALIYGRPFRFGAYGDPMAINIEFWQELIKTCNLTKTTGYTHSFKQSWAKPYAKFLMASADNLKEATEAVALGFRYFRTRKAGTPLGSKEFECPASKEQGNRLSCGECFACNGTSFKETGANPVIILHGTVSNSKKGLAHSFEA